MIVIDASATGALILEDEQRPPDDVSAMILEGPLLAPAHWPIEIASMVLVAERRQRLKTSDRRFVFAQAKALRVVIQRDDDHALWDRAIALASRYGLTIYDAAYLELAERLGARLTTLDRPLRQAAGHHGVDVLTW